MTRRVAILCEFGTLNGGEHSLLSVLPQVASAGWEPVVVCPASGALNPALRQKGIAVEPMEFHGASPAAVGRAGVREELSRTFRRVAPRLVHANSLSMGRLSGPVVAERRIPSFAHLRDIITLSRAAVSDLNLHRRLLAVSEATRIAHINQGLSAERAFVLYNGVDLAAFQAGAAEGWLHDELGIPRGAMLIGCIGQIILRKGQDTLAAAAMLLAKRRPELHYIFVGARHSEKLETRRHEAELRGCFASGPLRGDGHFLGVRDDVPRILRELTLLAHPARQEPLGRVLLEAGATGCAIVATDVGGTREIFPLDQGGALLVPPNDPEQLAAAMEALLIDPQRRVELGAQARRRIADAFDAARSAEELLRHYNEVADG